METPRNEKKITSTLTFAYICSVFNMPWRARTAFNSYDFLFKAIEAFSPASNDALNITRKIVCN